MPTNEHTSLNKRSKDSCANGRYKLWIGVCPNRDNYGIIRHRL